MHKIRSTDLPIVLAAICCIGMTVALFVVAGYAPLAISAGSSEYATTLTP